MPRKYPDTLWTNETMNVGESVSSRNGAVTLVLQPDGNLVLYKNPEHHALWASGTAGQKVGSAAMAWDGWLRLHEGPGGTGKKVFETGSGGSKDSKVVVQNDGNMVGFRNHGTNYGNDAIWATATDGFKQGSLQGHMGYVRHENGDFLSNAVKTTGHAIGQAMHAVQDVEGKISHEIAKIPIVGAPLHSLFDAAFMGAVGPSTMLVAVIIDGQALDKAFMAQVNKEIAIFKDVGPYAQMVVSFIPGIGTAISAAIGVGLALANGQPIDQVIMAGVAGVLPGGPLAKAAVSMAEAGIKAAVEHTKFDLATLGSTAAGVAADALSLPPTAKNALMAGINMAGQLVQGVKVETALTMAAVAALPVSQAIKNGISTATSVALDLAHGQRIDRTLLNHIGDAVSAIPMDSKLKKVLLDTARTGKALGSGHPEEALANALRTAASDGLITIGSNGLPKQVQEAIHVGAALGTGISHQAQRAAQLTHVVPGKLLQSGIQIAKTLPAVAEARKLVKSGTQGFDTAAGLMQQRAKLFDVVHLRAQQQGENKKGFDMAMALHVGLVVRPPAPTLSPAAQAGRAVTYGMQGAPPDNKQALMSPVATHPSASVGAIVAVQTISAGRETWFLKLLRALGLYHGAPAPMPVKS